MKTRQSWHTLVCAALVVTVIVVGAGPYHLESAGAAQTERPGVIFMHHSTGGGLIWEGGLREAFTAQGYDLWDHGYNDEGLTDPDGNALGTNWEVPDDNTDPDGWYTIFNQPVTDPPTNTFSHMLQYDIIIFKSCFPSSDIWDDARLEEYRSYYLSIRDVIDQHPDKLFIPWTTPPLVPDATMPENAQRARRWAAYLTSDEYLAGHPNIAVFDIFSIWSDQDGYLRSEYRVSEDDSHPNAIGNQTATPLLVQFVDAAWRSFSPGAAPVVEPPVEPTTEPVSDQPAEQQPAEGPVGAATGSLIGDFESGDFQDVWWGDVLEGENVFTCAPDQPGYKSDHALRMKYQLGADTYAGCGRDLVAGADWAAAEGLSFVWRSETPGQRFNMILMVDDTPFETVLQTPGQDWVEVLLPWSMFTKAEWAEGGVDIFDPARVTALGISVGDWEQPQQGTIWLDTIQISSAAELPAGVLPSGAVPYDKFALWTNGTQLRGANIWQRLVVPWVDGTEFLGPGPVGPPYVQDDFFRLAALGANYVNISGPGLFTETPPYVLDPAVQANLDNLLTMIAAADMFAVISFRTGPGRSDFTFYWDESADWGDASLLNDAVWQDPAAQEAWVAMWRYTAERYRNHPIVVGYDLMVEPNGPDRMLGIYEPEDYYPTYAGTITDWNQLYPRLTVAIREVDPDTPILAASNGWSQVSWLSYVQPAGDPRTVYTVHQYAPGQYTQQEAPAANAYPGQFDANWDGVPDTVDRAWLESLLGIVDSFKATYGAPVSVNEFGVTRWTPGAAAFLNDEMDLFEQRGMNYALWSFDPAWEPYSVQVDGFNFLHGTDPDQHANVESSALLDVIRAYWGRNTVRPSSLGVN